MTDEMLFKRRDDACHILIYWLQDLTRIVRDPSGEWATDAGLPDVMLGGTITEQCEAAIDRRLVRHIGLDELLRLNQGRVSAKPAKCYRCFCFGGSPAHGGVSRIGSSATRCDWCGTRYRLHDSTWQWVEVDSLEAVKP